MTKIFRFTLLQKYLKAKNGQAFLEIILKAEHCQETSLWETMTEYSGTVRSISN